MDNKTHEWNGEDIFVFGSNLAGRHGKGAAEFALKHAGARYGNGIGIQGKSYAIRTEPCRLGFFAVGTV